MFSRTIRTKDKTNPTETCALWENCFIDRPLKLVNEILKTAHCSYQGTFYSSVNKTKLIFQIYVKTMIKRYKTK